MSLEAAWAWLSKTQKERKEGPPDRPLFLVTLMRHAKPFYKDEGHDLTPEGVEQAIAAGTQMKSEGYFEGSDVFFFHSPQARAKGTLDFVTEAAGVQESLRRTSRQLRAGDFYNHPEFLASVDALAEEEEIDKQEAATKHHYTHPMHEEGTVLEQHSKKRQRLYRALEYLARWFDKHPYPGPNLPHVLAVSHFEIITHLVADVFGVPYTAAAGQQPRYSAPGLAEYLKIAVYPSSAKDSLRLSITYNGQTKTAVFDRRTRSVTVIDQ